MQPNTLSVLEQNLYTYQQCCESKFEHSYTRQLSLCGYLNSDHPYTAKFFDVRIYENQIWPLFEFQGQIFDHWESLLQCMENFMLNLFPKPNVGSVLLYTSVLGHVHPANFLFHNEYLTGKSLLILDHDFLPLVNSSATIPLPTIVIPSKCTIQEYRPISIN